MPTELRNPTTRIKIKRGNCYEAHARALLNNEEQGLLCHGTVWHEKTSWHGHCWIENNNIVIDMASGHPRTELPIEVYYYFGKVKDVRRYTLEQVREKVLSTGNYGAWE